MINCIAVESQQFEGKHCFALNIKVAYIWKDDFDIKRNAFRYAKQRGWYGWSCLDMIWGVYIIQRCGLGITKVLQMFHW